MHRQCAEHGSRMRKKRKRSSTAEKQSDVKRRICENQDRASERTIMRLCEKPDVDVNRVGSKSIQTLCAVRLVDEDSNHKHDADDDREEQVHTEHHLPKMTPLEPDRQAYNTFPYWQCSIILAYWKSTKEVQQASQTSFEYSACFAENVSIN